MREKTLESVITAMGRVKKSGIAPYTYSYKIIEHRDWHRVIIHVPGISDASRMYDALQKMKSTKLVRKDLDVFEFNYIWEGINVNYYNRKNIQHSSQLQDILEIDSNVKVCVVKMHRNANPMIYIDDLEISEITSTFENAKSFSQDELDNLCLVTGLPLKPILDET